MRARPQDVGSALPTHQGGNPDEKSVMWGLRRTLDGSEEAAASLLGVSVSVETQGLGFESLICLQSHP